jgi:hypothetical protein
VSNENDGWLNKLKAIIPAGTLAMYFACTGMYGLFWPTSADLPVWAPFLVILTCLALHIVYGIKRKKEGWAIALTAVAFVLFGLTQPYSGVLSAFHASGAVNFIFSIMVLVYLSLVAWLYSGNLAEDARS